MKGFRRFGGEFSGSGDSGNFAIATFGLVLLVVCCLASLLFNLPELAILGFVLLFVLTVISTFFGGSLVSRVRTRRKNRYLQVAELQFDAKNYRASMKAIEQARISGDIPEKFDLLYAEATRMSASAERAQ